MEINKNKNYLVIFDDNWADEMDITGFCTMNGEDVLDMKEKLFDYKDEIECYFGSNESNEYSNGKEFWEVLKFKEITDEQENMIDVLFDGDFGFSQVIYNVIEQINE